MELWYATPGEIYEVKKSIAADTVDERTVELLFLSVDEYEEVSEEDRLDFISGLSCLSRALGADIGAPFARNWKRAQLLCRETQEGWMYHEWRFVSQKARRTYPWTLCALARGFFVERRTLAFALLSVSLKRKRVP